MEHNMLRLIFALVLSLASAASWSIDNGRYKIVSSSSGLNMDVAGASTADGAKILQYTARSALNQQFDVVALSDHLPFVDENLPHICRDLRADLVHGAAA
jgi:hypothetical protein